MRLFVFVVCVCFNILKYLDEVIVSIYVQGYFNFELIVVDDGFMDDIYECFVMFCECYGFQFYCQVN